MSEEEKEAGGELPGALSAFLRRWGIPRGLVFRVGSCWLINLTPHPLRLDDGRVIPAAPESVAKLLEAKPIDRLVFRTEDGTEFVEPTFMPEDRGLEMCREACGIRGLYLVGSIISARAYGAPVVSPIVTPETRRKPPAERVVFAKRWTCYWR